MYNSQIPLKDSFHEYSIPPGPGIENLAEKAFMKQGITQRSD